MRFRVLLLSAALVLFGGVKASAQDGVFDWGIKAGASLNMMPWTSLDMFDRVVPNVGFYGGGFLSLTLSEKMFGQAELLYTRKGVSTRSEALGDYRRNISYIQLPVLIGWDILGDDTWRVMTGPALAYYVGQNQFYTTEIAHPSAIGSEPNILNLSWVLEGNYAITDALFAEVRFDMGITRTFKTVGTVQDEGRNATVSLGICYRFGY